MSTNTRLTKKMAQYLIKRELGISGANVRVERRGLLGNQYVMNMGLWIEICVAIGMVKDKEVISLRVFQPFGQGNIQLYFNPETLAEDYDAECYHNWEVEMERCESCPYAPLVDEKCSSFRAEFGKTVCYGTREREECTCGGDKSKCDFYKK